ncbi:hypothetical protein IIC_04597 [Bacillus cereus VD021]|uniref:DNA-binding protein HU n=1 Tax=Bacillus cereus VD021 TaxID=1053224 RepID=R8HCB0_BACCE|nr:hypothetical protein IIC_04597 [Bacillus cereus VD021]
MNKTELIKQVAERASLSQKDATASVQAILDQVTQALAQGVSVQLIGFGTI